MHLLRTAFFLLLYLLVESLVIRRRQQQLISSYFGRHDHRQRSSFRCYLLLLALLYCDLLREFSNNNNNSNRRKENEIGKSSRQQQHQREHMFIYNSYAFNSAGTAEDTESSIEPVTTTTTFVVLFLAHRQASVHEKLICTVEDGEAANGSNGRRKRRRRKMEAFLEKINSLDLCALDLFVLTCTIKMSSQPQQPMFNLIILDKNWMGWRRPTHVKLIPSKAEQKPRGLVLCISRILAYERWQLLITALEAYRLFGVDLVVSHVQSALAPVFELMRAYEREDLLRIRPGIRLPHTTDMPWDPNAETEFNAQMPLAHECFYEFRASTRFIGLIDWDDLLVPSGHFRSLPAAFEAATSIYPDAAYFLVNKLESTFVQQTKSPRRFDLAQLVEKGVRTAEMYNDEKMVVRPRKLRGFWMHNSRHLEPGSRPVQLLTNYSLMLHLANEERVGPGEFRLRLLQRFNVSEMQRHSRLILDRLAEQQVLANLPRAQPYFDAIAECHRLIFAYYKAVGHDRSVCLSYSLCELPRVEKPCIAVRSHFQSLLTRGGANAVHVRSGSEFVRLANGCVDPENGGAI